MQNLHNSLNLSFQGGSQNGQYFDCKCEWDLPKYVVLPPAERADPNIDLYEDPKYVAMLPDFGFFATIK